MGGILRLMLGFMFVMAGILKVVVPSLGQAFSGQLIAANIPLQEIVLFTFPIVETVLGILLVVGFHARLSAAAAAMSMVVATYVHAVVKDPSLFPLQPVEPVGPLVLLAIALYVLWAGAGAWSIDLNEADMRW
jgi:uncharacterized membrane protein YphA (DoxX/SURF4 family)